MRGIQQKEVEDLEAQLRIMSQAAAEAIERASRLENELASSRRERISKSSSLSSLSSDGSLFSTPEDRLDVLENALDAIHRARGELSKPYNYQYI